MPSPTLASRKTKVGLLTWASSKGKESERESDSDPRNPSGLLRTSVVVGAGTLLLGCGVIVGAVVGSSSGVTGGSAGVVAPGDPEGAVVRGDAGLRGVVVGASANSEGCAGVMLSDSAIVVAPSTDAGGRVEIVLRGVVLEVTGWFTDWTARAACA